MDMPSRRCLTLLLTSAPCAGKSTIADMLERHLTGHRTRVIVVRETATALILSGGSGMGPIE
jgi:adenylylsulfate kinase-like enzyme